MSLFLIYPTFLNHPALAHPHLDNELVLLRVPPADDQVVLAANEPVEALKPVGLADHCGAGGLAADLKGGGSRFCKGGVPSALTEEHLCKGSSALLQREILDHHIRVPHPGLISMGYIHVPRPYFR